MKKILTILLIALVSASAVWAVPTDPAESPALEAVTHFDPVLSTRAKGMGGTGIAYSGRSDAYVLNPAAFAGRNAFFLPSVQVDLYHPYDIIKKDAAGQSILDKFMDQENPEAMMNGMTDLLSSLKAGRGKLADVNAQLGFNIKGFTMMASVTDSIHTFGEGTGGLQTNLINETSIVQNIGYAHAFDFGKAGKFAFGINFHPTAKLYNQALSAEFVMDNINPGEGTEGAGPDMTKIFMEQIPFAAGMAYPFDLGVSYKIGLLSFGITARNINGTYNMKAYDNLNGFMAGPADLFKGGDFKIKTPWSLDAGMTFVWENCWFRPVINFDVVDIVGLCKEDFSKRDLLNHINMGAEIRLLNFLDARVGLSSGWLSVGAGIDISVLKLDIAYYTHEFGDVAGDYGLDAVSVRFNLGWDR